MANEGYIKLYRKMMKWGWYTDSNTKCVFLHLLFLACYEPCFYRGVDLQEGQLITTINEISTGTNISAQCVRTALNRLKSTNEITIESSPKFSLITLNNYADYQGGNKGSNKQLTNNQQTTNKQLTNPLIVKKLRNKEVKNNIYSTLTAEAVEELKKREGLDFDTRKFLAHYNKTGWKDKNGQPIESWEAAAVCWALTERKPKQKKENNPSFDIGALEKQMVESEGII